jgi:hypothetical protein
MDRLTDRQTYQQFATANCEFSIFLQKVAGLANGTESITEPDLQSLSRRLAALAPEVQEIRLQKAPEDELPNEISEYLKNLRAVQAALETVHCVMLARKNQLDGARRHLRGLQGWVSAYQQTT